MKKAHKKALLWSLFAHPITFARGVCLGFKRGYAELKQDGPDALRESVDEKKIEAIRALDRIAEIKGF